MQNPDASPEHARFRNLLLQTTEAVSLEESLSVRLAVPATQPVELLRHLVHAPVDLWVLKSRTTRILHPVTSKTLHPTISRMQANFGRANWGFRRPVPKPNNRKRILLGGGGGTACHNNIPGAWRSKEPSLQT